MQLIRMPFLLNFAAKMAYRARIPKCNPVILEPMMKIEVVTPEENMGDVVGDLNRRRGQLKEWMIEQVLKWLKQRFLFLKCLDM